MSGPVSGLHALRALTKAFDIKHKHITKMVITLECDEVALIEVTSFLNEDMLETMVSKYHLVEKPKDK